ncbi:ricin-type beta-trefoil lectin domain protein [Streptosporangium amethystogenes]|uniref:ricin-type beta-trefoil lectin domain protein n=1 Tax=Streptosporangium amethystogenes TaxID=2002 RepID=UPI0037BE059E
MISTSPRPLPEPPGGARRPRTPLARVGGLLAALLLTSAALVPSAAGAQTTAVQSNTTQTIAQVAAAPGPLVWSDEFDAAAGTGPDTTKWRRDVGGGGFGNNERQYYTAGNENIAHDGAGNLVITARKGNPAGYGCWYGSCEYTSGKLTTAATFTRAYGRFEARMKLPRGKGMWPAFWMLGDNIGSVDWPASGEIDIMENVGSVPGQVLGSLHGPGYSGGSPLSGSYTLPGGQAFADAFHTFAVDWEPGSVTWYVDGIQYSRKTPADTRGNPWVYDHPFFMILNLAVGGNWPGSPDASTTFPQQLTIDYVRVYAQGGGSGGRTGQITGIGGKCVDVNAANTANGTAIQLYDCNGTGAQQWTIGTDGTIRALGKCMDVTAAGTANGTQIQLYDCNGTGAQQWVYTAAHDIVNPAAGKCLDATSQSSANNTRLQIWDCSGNPNQKWTAPAA